MAGCGHWQEVDRRPDAAKLERRRKSSSHPITLLMSHATDSMTEERWTTYQQRNEDTCTGGGTMLELLGVSDIEERVYRALLWDPEASLNNLAFATGVGQTELRRLLSALEMKGVIHRTKGKSHGYVPVAPDIAVEGLIQRRQEEIELIRAHLPQLREEYHSPADRGDPVEFAEVVSGREAVARRFAQLQQSATETILIFDNPPYALPDNADAQLVNQLEFERLEEGIQYRTIYSREAMAISGRSNEIHAYVKAGEVAHVSPELPMKLAIADRRLAIMPLIVNAPTHNAPSQVESAVVVHQSSLLDALATLFAAFWDRSLPLSFSAEAGKELGTEEDDEERELLLSLLTAGLTDEAIAHQLGISIRTVRRRVRHLMDQLGVITRFQAGVQAAKRGWL
jgi:sugar-specific transcriptional regulator TrmB/DNA-binding CsgD family transcriptional regulator